jgi:nucleoside-diphosphate-sugar epimerase
MKIVIIGTGLIGSKTVAILRQGGHEVVADRPKAASNAITGEGLKEAIAGAQGVIDLANSPSFEDKAVKPAKLLAVFVVDTNETELTIPFGN